MTRGKVALSAIEDLKRQMQEAPDRKVTEMSMVRAIQMLAPSIRAMQARGYKMAEVAEILASRGIPIAATTLRSYLSRFVVEPTMKPLHNGHRGAIGRRAMRRSVPPTSTGEG
jgi:hypothetical protein